MHLFGFNIHQKCNFNITRGSQLIPWLPHWNSHLEHHYICKIFRTGNWSQHQKTFGMLGYIRLWLFSVFIFPIFDMIQKIILAKNTSTRVGCASAINPQVKIYYQGERKGEKVQYTILTKKSQINYSIFPVYFKSKTNESIFAFPSRVLSS